MKQKTCTPKPIITLMKDIEVALTDEDIYIYHVLELEESILSKPLCFPRQSSDSMQCLSNHQ